MSHCERMKRPCTCGRLSVYTRDGIVPDGDNGAHCLTDSELRAAAPLLLREWQRRFSGAEIAPVRLYA